MQMLDRVILIVRPRAPLSQTALGTASAADLADLRRTPAVYAVEPTSDHDPKLVVEAHWRTIFEAELAVWERDRSTWPPKRTCALFGQWFDVDVCPMVVDLAPRPSAHRRPIPSITDLSHYLDDNQQPVPDLPAPVRNIATFMGSIVADVSTVPSMRPRRLDAGHARASSRRPSLPAASPSSGDAASAATTA